MLSKIYEELEKLALFDYTFFTLVKEDDNILIYKFQTGDFDYVVKYYKNDNKEIKMYRELRDKIDLVYSSADTEKILLLDDINEAVFYNFVKKEELEDDLLIKNIAMWYKRLHNAGYTYNNFTTDNIVIKDNYEKVSFLDLKYVENNNEFEKDLENIKKFDEVIAEKIINHYRSL